jgi:8-amino-7-oxononanoate synthase
MDVALAHEGFLRLADQKEALKKEIAKRQKIARAHGHPTPGLIVDIPCDDVLGVQERLMEEGFLVGAVRPPTVKRPMIRVIARLGESAADLEKLLQRLGDVCL